MTSEPSAEGDRRDAETNRIAAEGNRMTAEDARVVLDAQRTADAADRAAHRRRIRYAQLGAYLLIVSVAALGFWQIKDTQNDLCRTTLENRQASRNIVTAIEQLGTGLVLDGKRVAATKKEQASLDLLDQFEKEQLRLLTEPTC